MSGKIKKRIKQSSGEKGFSLVEMSVAIVLLSTLTLSVLLFMRPAVDLMVKKNFVNGAEAEARLAMARMVKDINQIRNDSSISTANSTQLTFTDVNNASVSYTVSSGSLLRNGVVLAKNVSSLALTYYASNNSVISTPTLSPSTNIARVQAVLTVTAGSNSATVRGHMFPRNL